MRSIIGQYTLDHHRRPQSLDDLVTSGYLKEVAPDPMSGRKDTWVLEWSDDPKSPGIIGTHSSRKTSK
jgi:general secretion pathway protein G